MGDPMHIDFARVNDILGLPSSNTFTTFDSLPAEFNHETFWKKKITGGIFSCFIRDTANSIIHLCLLIAHRIFVCTVFARKEVGQVTNIEVFFLWCMTRCENPLTPNFALFFFYKCALMKTKASGDICIGGFFTLLARGLDIDLPDDHTPIDNKILLDECVLTNMHHIRHRNGVGFTWFFLQGVEYLILPDPRVSHFTFHDHIQRRLERSIT
ncbi:unnamed protein product [Lactuca saligna]|uniref:Uncharacterized protein n=1 Tax=Lactuca saligna TaxID=75948 RepID=A0AA35YEV9_LACSI|nr:unnamed protein product [Lactuca saligna]